MSNPSASDRCTVLVTSCDRYRDIEAPFLALWRRHWPDCPFELVAVRESGGDGGVRMNPNPPRAVKNSAYAVSCQAGYWNREFLFALARRTKSAWEFERYGSYMFDESDQRPIMVTERKEFPFVDALHKGYWEPEGVALLKREGIGYDFSRRGLPPFWPRLKSNLKKAVFAVFPWELVVRVQNIFNLGMK